MELVADVLGAVGGFQVCRRRIFRSGRKVEKKTPLYDEHVKAKARMVPFAGFLMPLQYSGIIEEHRSVRERIGMFDLSHMGEFHVKGADAVGAIDGLVTNDIVGLEEGQIRYSPMCYPHGGIVDDLLVYRFRDRLMLVVNASNIEKDLDWIQGHVSGDVQVENSSSDIALIAVQGPCAAEFLQKLTQTDLSGISYYHFRESSVSGIPAIVSRTGYTGEDGFELYATNDDASKLWQILRESGEPQGLQLAGLGARDTLRLEAGYMLYGNDIDETTSPLEAGLGWTVKFGDSAFIGRDVLERQKAAGVERRIVALEMLDRAIPRPHFPIARDGRHVGGLTSGTFSPTFSRGVGLGYVETGSARTGTDVSVRIREGPHPARVVKKPIYKREGA